MKYPTQETQRAAFTLAFSETEKNRITLWTQVFIQIYNKGNLYITQRMCIIKVTEYYEVKRFINKSDIK